MATPRRIYGRGEQPASLYANNNGPNKFNRYFYLRAGKILEVDDERYRIRIEWLQGSGSPKWIPISFPYVGPSGFMGAVPEENSIGIFGFFDEGSGKGAPFLLTYLPVSQLAAFDYNTMKVNPDAVANEDENEVFYRFRKMMQGDMMALSPLGGELFLNKNVEISDELKDSILLRSADQSIISTSLNHFVFSDGASIYAGPAMRNSMNLYDKNGERLPGKNARELSISDGRDVIYIVPYGAPIEFDSQFYTEYRIEAEELSRGYLETNDINGRSVASAKDPVAIMTMGNLIGNDTRESNYGSILRPVLFANRFDQEGKFNLVQCAQNKGVDEASTIGLAYALYFPKSSSFMGVDKEGHYYMNLSASKANPLGSGRSMSVLADGNLKEVWGITADNNNSWDLTTKGGILWQVGNHNQLQKNRSIDIRTSNSMYLELGDDDEDGFAKQEKAFGNTYQYTEGSRIDEVGANHSLIISGLKTEHILGSASELVDSNKTVTVSDMFSEIVLGEKQCRFATRKTTITSGDDEYTMVNGDRKETFTLGNKKTKMIAGSIEDTVVVGNKKTSITTGSYEVKVTTGNISLSSKVGNVSVKALETEITGTIKASLKGVSVEIGNGPRGGVITGTSGTPSHFDYVTGSPLKGAATVKAGV